jgi:hypothetical protein
MDITKVTSKGKAMKFEVLAAIVTKNFILCDITLCSPLEFSHSADVSGDHTILQG